MGLPGIDRRNGTKAKVVEKVVDEDYYPVEGAVVTLKRTNQNATTDKDGVFILEEVPVYFDSLQVKKENVADI